MSAAFFRKEVLEFSLPSIIFLTFVNRGSMPYLCIILTRLPFLSENPARAKEILFLPRVCMKLFILPKSIFLRFPLYVSKFSQSIRVATEQLIVCMFQPYEGSIYSKI